MEHGLSTQNALELQSKHGKNTISVEHTFSLIPVFFAQFTTFINGILFFAALFFFLTHDILDALFILSVIVVNATLGFFQEYKAEKSLEKLKEYATPSALVIRDNEETQISSLDLVPGDIVVLAEGDRVPADGILIESHEIEFDESILTGESLPVAKGKDESVFSGTLITKGNGHMKVMFIGMDTRFGKIAQTLVSIETDKTPLQKQLEQLGKGISLFAIGISFLLIPIELSQGKELIPIILIAVSIGIAAIPEGLPAVITIALALGTSRMAKQNAIVRKMPAVETLGAIQILLVDKTGTLTQNHMRVKKMWSQDKEAHEKIITACVLGNTASLIKKADLPSGFDIVGDKTDGGLLLWATTQKPSIEEELKQGTILDEFVFDSRSKTITTLWERDKKKYVFVRGAPETIVKNSTMNSEERTKIEQLFEEYAKEGLRVIAFGYKTERFPKGKKREHLEQDLHFLGFVGLYDPPRVDIHKEIAKAKAAGIKTIMVTGDNEVTALAIAKEIGLVEKDEDVLTGIELEKISDEDLKPLITKTSIFARTKPQDKLRLVNLLKDQGIIVGVTGDGVNDALALKRADVGVAMGQTGTDVAKEASDIILTDDNYGTLVKAIEEGRGIYHNIVKAIIYLLSGNLVQLLLVFLAALVGLPSPLLPIQILWINLVTDGLPALALASDTKDPTLITKSPRNPKTPILSLEVIGTIMFIGGMLAISLFVTFSLLLNSFSEVQSRTIIFNLLIVARLLIAFLVRGNLLFSMNKSLVLVVLGTLLIQILITISPFFQTIFHLGW